MLMSEVRPMTSATAGLQPVMATAASSSDQKKRKSIEVVTHNDRAASRSND